MFCQFAFENRGRMRLLTNEVDSLKSRTEQLERYAMHSEHTFKTYNEVTLPAINQRIDSANHDNTRLEMWGRKWNVIVRGIDGYTQENGRVTLQKVTDFFRDVLKAPTVLLEDMQFQAYHRLPGGNNSDKPNIIVRLSSLLDRDDILSLAMKLPPKSGYSVVVDVPKCVVEERANLLNKRREMPIAERKKCKLVYTRDAPFVILRTKAK